MYQRLSKWNYSTENKLTEDQPLSVMFVRAPQVASLTLLSLYTIHVDEYEYVRMNVHRRIYVDEYMWINEKITRLPP